MPAERKGSFVSDSGRVGDAEKRKRVFLTLL